MTVEKNERGEKLMHPCHWGPTDPRPLVATGLYPPEMLFVGADHLLNRQEVMALMMHLQRWLDTGAL